MSFQGSFPQPQPPDPNNPIPQLPADFDQPEQSRLGTIQSGRYSPWEVFKDYAPSPEEAKAAKNASRAFMMYWLPGTALGLAGASYLARSGRINNQGLAGMGMMIGTMMAGEFTGRKLGEQAGTKVLMRELPRDSKLLLALEQYQRTGKIDPNLFEPPPPGQVDAFGNPDTKMRPRVEMRQRERIERVDSRDIRGSKSSREGSTKVLESPSNFGTVDSEAEKQQRFDELMYGKGDSPADQAYQNMQQQQSDFIRTAEDFERAERMGKVKRNEYGDIIE